LFIVTMAMGKPSVTELHYLGPQTAF
jgi:hypothetical protein